MNTTTNGTVQVMLALPIARDESTMDTLDTGVSKLKSCMVRSVVVREVNPFSSSCCNPEKSAHLSCTWSFSSFYRFSALPSSMWASSLFNSLKAIRYSNSKSDSIKATVTQKMVANRVVGWFICDGLWGCPSRRMSFWFWRRGLAGYRPEFCPGWHCEAGRGLVDDTKFLGQREASLMPASFSSCCTATGCPGVYVQLSCALSACC